MREPTLSDEPSFAYLSQPLSKVRGITSTRLLKLTKLIGGDKIADLLFHIPNYYLTRNKVTHLFPDLLGKNVALSLEILNHERGFRAGLPHKVTAQIVSGQIVTLSFFNFNFPFLKKLLPQGKSKIICGKLQRFKEGYQIANPDHILSEQEYEKVKIEPIYPLCSGIQNKYLATIISYILADLPEFPEWINSDIIKRYQMVSFKEAITKLHKPDNEDDLLDKDKYQKRLAYDELLIHQYALQLMRLEGSKIKGVAHDFSGKLVADLKGKLPFALTSCQESALAEISANQQSNERMYRLLQGDVGSGKTLVALAAMLNVVESGRQAALMVPTALLAEQHYVTFCEYLKDLPVKISLLTGGLKAKEKKEVKSKILANEVQIVVGTHALFYESVEFHNLGLAIVDEQHRFGVKQRAKLLEKGEGSDLLLMSATPIPRTLALTLYGDMEVSMLQHKPQGRKPIQTSVIGDNKLPQIVASLKEALRKGEKAYWICPLVSESEIMDLAACEKRFAEFQKFFGTDIVGLIHGQMSDKEKDQVMQDFYDNKIKLLVATTVIEVGINVPDATLIIIEQAERFGLAQLHQLRGRVGRSSLDSKCLLLYAHGKISQFAKRKLSALRDSEDGFYLAEEDLKIRGVGDIVGTKQSGVPEFKFADLAHDIELLKLAQTQIKLLFNKDPQLTSKTALMLQCLHNSFNFMLSSRG